MSAIGRLALTLSPCGRGIGGLSAAVLKNADASHRLCRAAKRGERLSLMSSGFWLPWASVSQDCVEDCEQLSGGSNDRHQLGFAGGNEAVTELADLRIEPAGHQSAHKQDAPHARSAAADEAFAAPFSGLPGP